MFRSSNSEFELSHFDRLLIKKRSDCDCDNIRQFKTKIGKDLPIHKFEWVFDIHSFLESFYKFDCIIFDMFNKIY